MSLAFYTHWRQVPYIPLASCWWRWVDNCRECHFPAAPWCHLSPFVKVNRSLLRLWSHGVLRSVCTRCMMDPERSHWLRIGQCFFFLGAKASRKGLSCNTRHNHRRSLFFSPISYSPFKTKGETCLHEVLKCILLFRPHSDGPQWSPTTNPGGFLMTQISLGR